jgi:hypothetical protein
VAHYTYCNFKPYEMSQNLLLKLDNVMQKYLEQAQDLVFNENALLQTLGFDVAIDHPHTHVVRCCHLVRGKCLAVTTGSRGSSNKPTRKSELYCRCCEHYYVELCREYVLIPYQLVQLLCLVSRITPHHSNP